MEEDVKEVLSDPEAPPPRDKDSPTSICIAASALAQTGPIPQGSTDAALGNDHQMCFSTARECPKVSYTDITSPWASLIRPSC